MASEKHNFIFFAKSNCMKNGLVQNLSWVLVGGIVAKIIGGVYRIVLTRVLGVDIGLYQLVFSVYSLLIVLISSGIPLAMSKLISESKTEKAQRKVLYGTTSIMITISGVLAIVLCVGSKGLAQV